MTDQLTIAEALTRPIIGMENRTPQEVFDIMVDRIRGHLTRAAAPEGEEWQPIATAPRDGTYILAIVAPDRGRHLEHHAGRVFAIRHEGMTASDYDLGWAVYPGFGGASDFDFTHWRPLPAPPSALAAKGEEQGE